MTIIVGVVCKDGLAVACDSQASSFRGVEVKRLDYTKMYSFKFQGAQVLVVGAGQGSFIGRAAEFIEAKRIATVFQNTRQVADLAEDAIKELTARYVIGRARDLGMLQGGPAKLGPHDGAPAMPSVDVALLLAVSCSGKSDIYIVTEDGVAEREQGYTSLGSGSVFAEYLLSRLYEENMSLEAGIRTAAYVVEEVKKADVYCGGPTQIAVIKSNDIEIKTAEEVERIVAQLALVDRRIKETWRTIVHEPRSLVG